MCANFTSPDEEISSFRNVVIIQCGVVFVTLWEKKSFYSVPMCCKWLCRQAVPWCSNSKAEGRF